MLLNPQKPQKRNPRFRRVSTLSFRLQARDKEIIYQVYKHRFLTSRHIQALISGSDKWILKRLQYLYHGNFLDRPREQIINYRAGSGSKPMIYGIGNKGADLLKQEYGIQRTMVDWTSKNRTVQTFFLEHTLLVADFMVCLELACRQTGNVRIIEFKEILAGAPKETRNKPNPYLLKIETVSDIQGESRKINIGLVPDKVFGLYFNDEPDGKNKAYFILEADRSTMPIFRKSLYRTSFFKKLLGFNNIIL